MFTIYDPYNEERKFRKGNGYITNKELNIYTFETENYDYFTISQNIIHLIDILCRFYKIKKIGLKVSNTNEDYHFIDENPDLVSDNDRVAIFDYNNTRGIYNIYNKFANNEIWSFYGLTGECFDC